MVSIDSTGSEAASPSAPDYAGRLVLAEITLSNTDTEITESKIKDVRPFLTPGRVSVDGTTIEAGSDGKLKTADPSYLVLQSDVEQADSQSSWTKLTFDNQVQASGISQSSGVITLSSGKLYKLHYSIVCSGSPASYWVWLESRIHVLSGDLSWSLGNDSDNVSYQKTKLELTGTPDIISHTGQCIILPASTTTLQLEVITKSGSWLSKVINCSLSVWS